MMPVPVLGLPFTCIVTAANESGMEEWDQRGNNNQLASQSAPQQTDTLLIAESSLWSAMADR